MVINWKFLNGAEVCVLRVSSYSPAPYLSHTSNNDDLMLSGVNLGLRGHSHTSVFL